MRPPARAVLLHPAVWVALALLVVNDHALKGSGLVPGWLTGKLSDVAGVFGLAAVLGGLLARRVPPWATAAAVGVAFAAMKTLPSANLLATRTLGATALDPTDLVALLTLPFAVWIARAPSSRPSRLETLVAVVAGVACAATSRPPSGRNYPSWTLKGDDKGVVDRTVGCAHLQMWVSKSGKEGLGISTEGGGCPARVELDVSVAGVSMHHDAIAVAPGEVAYAPFAFDNERLWNDGHVTGTLRVTVRVEGGEDGFTVPMEHVWTGPHRWERSWDRPKPPMPVATGPMVPP